MSDRLSEAQAAILFCSIHKDEEVEMFCNKCSKPTCTKCLTSDHAGHEVDTIAKLSRKLNYNRDSYLDSLAKKIEINREMNKRKMYEVMCHNECLASRNKSGLQSQRAQIHSLVDELIDNQISTCESCNTKLTQNLGSIQKQQMDADAVVQEMMDTFRNTEMSGVDLVQYNADLKTRIEGMAIQGLDQCYDR